MKLCAMNIPVAAEMKETYSDITSMYKK